MKKVLIHKRYTRFWHWAQVLLMFLFLLTGFEVHGTLSLFGFERAVSIHNTCAWTWIVLILFTAFWHFSTGEWRQFAPTTRNMMDMVRYYLKDIFIGYPHPVAKTYKKRLNPLQRAAYFTLKVFLVPLQVGTGLLYYYYERWPEWGFSFKLETIAALHAFGAFLLLAFMILHVYLTTTGHTVFSNLKAMITGYEILEDSEMEMEA